jgi:hypothetical protein
MVTPLKKTLQILGITSLIGTAVLSPAIYRQNFPEKINNTSDLIRIATEEEKIARKDNSTNHIYWTYGKTPWGTAGSRKLSEGNYQIILDKAGKNRTTIRHELYHIYAGHCDNAFAKMQWTTKDKLHDELAANLYAYYGLRL